MAGNMPVRTYVVPPRISSFPAERDQLEFSSRSLVFPSDGSRLLRAWGPTDHPFVVSIEEGKGRWNVRAWGAAPEEARRAVRQLFSFDHALEAFYHQVRAEPVLRGTDRTYRGLRMPRDPTLYESLLHSIIGQQLSVRAANTIKHRLFEATESFLEVEGVEIPRVPGPRELIRVGADGLRRVGLSHAKSQALLGIAEGEAAGRFANNAFATNPRDEAVKLLMQERGVGPWTAENALMRGVGRTDLFIAGDLGIRVALERFGVISRAAREEGARNWADRHYPGWGSYATLYLWRKLVAGG